MTVFFRERLSVKTVLAYIVCVSLALLLGCQKPQPQPIEQQPQTQSVPQDEIVDLSLLCKNIEKNIASIDAERTTFALEQINQDLKLCLPLSNFEEQKHFLSLSNQMYRKFLTVNRNAAQQAAFEHYAFDLSQHPTLQQNHFEQLNLRDQYLLKHTGQAYIEVIDVGEGQLQYRRSPEYLAKIFAPYMPPAEQIFIENLAAQNMQPAFTESRLSIEPHEIVNRALFWEEYLKQYPNSSYRKDARYLLQRYSVFLFLGLSDSPVSESYIDRYAIQNSAMEEIEKLAKLKNSTLAAQADKFLQFLQLSEAQRLQQIPVQTAKKIASSSTESGLAQQQLAQYLGLSSLQPSPTRDCFSDAICH